MKTIILSLLVSLSALSVQAQSRIIVKTPRAKVTVIRPVVVRPAVRLTASRMLIATPIGARVVVLRRF